MPLTADQLNDLGRWPFIQFAGEAKRDAAFDRYRRYLERQRAEARKSWIVQP